MVDLAPEPVDVQDFQFKLQCKFKIFNNEDVSVFNRPCSLITSASRYGLVFVGTNLPEFQVLTTKYIEECSEEGGEVKNYLKRTVRLPSRPTHLAVNCDCSYLCVTIQRDDCCIAQIYNIAAFSQPNVAPEREILISNNPGVYIVELSWNPTVTGVLTVCKSDKSLSLYEIKGSGVEINELPPNVGATCMCWSPKGKQIAVGSHDGKITQFKPDLKAVKVTNAPKLEGSCSLIALQWISNYQFIGVYYVCDRPCVVVVDAPKTGETKFTNYEDICYSRGNARPAQFYMIFQPTWNILMAASSNSMEVGVMGAERDTWTQWIVSDESRAELPLTDKRQDTLPVGLSLDTSATKPVPWEEKNLPPAPFLYLYSHHGVLCCFSVVNVRQGAQPLCQAVEGTLQDAAFKYFSKESTERGDKQVLQEQKVQVPPTKPEPPQLAPSIKPAQPAPQKPPQSSLFSFSTPPKTPPAFSFLSQPAVTRSQNLFAAQPVVVSSTPLQKPPDPKPQIVEKKTVAKPLFPKTEAKPIVAITPQAAQEAKAAPSPVSSEDTENLINKMILEECHALETELKNVIRVARAVKIDLGPDEEGVDLVNNIDELQQFLDEITEITNGQVAEVQGLKQQLIQTWSWFEDARSRFAVMNDETMANLIKIQPLDPACQHHLEEITGLLYYVESQLAQANRALDEQWDNFQDSCKKIYRVQTPTIETIFQSMVRQNAVLQKQMYLLKDIKARLRSHTKTTTSTPVILALENDSNIADKLRNLTLHPQDVFEMIYERVVNKQKHLSNSKVEKLRCHLTTRKVTHVAVSKPQITSFQVTPRKLESLQEKTMPKGLFGSVPTAPPNTPLNKESASAFASFGDGKASLETDAKAPFTFAPTFSLGTTTKTTKTKINFNQSPPKSATLATLSLAANSMTFKAPFKPEGTSFTSLFTPPQVQVVSQPSGGVLTSKPATSAAFSFLGSTESKTADNNFAWLSASPDSSKPIVSTPVTTTAVSSAIFGSVISSASAKPVSSTAEGAKGFFTTPSTGTALNFFGKLTAITSASSIASAAPGIASQSVVITSPEKLASVASTTPQSATTATTIFGTAVGKSATTSSIFGTTTSGVSATTPTSISITSGPTAAITSIFGKSAGTGSLFSSAVTSTTSTGNIFGKSGSIFATSAASTTAASIFGQISSTTGSIFGTVTTTCATSTTPTILGKHTSSSVTSSTSGTTGTSPAASIFGTANLSASTAISAKSPDSTVATTTPSSIFATTIASTLPSSIPSTTTTPSIATSTTTSIFTTPVTSIATPTTTTSIFAAPATSTTTPATTTSIFGSPSTPTTTTSIFGTPATSTTTPTTTTTIFGTPATSTTTSTTTTSIFGTPSISTTSSTTSATVFGTPATPSTAASIFGTVVTTSDTTQVTSNIFGNATTTPTASALGTSTTNVFGQATTAASIFAQPAATTAGSIFGQGVASSPASGGSIFGSTPSSGTVFGGTPTTGSIFGTPTTSTFGAVPASTASSPFAPQPVFGGTPKTTASTFGGAPVFGGGTATFGASAFGQKPAFGGGSVFGSSATTASPFGSPGAVFSTTSSPFGSTTSSGGAFASAPSQINSFSFASAASNAPSTGSDFGFAKPATTFGFGALNLSTTTTSSGFGFGQGQTQNPFARTSGQEQQASFSGSLFGTPATTSSSGSIFGSGTAAFGSTTQTFGSSPSFGAQPAFGQQQSGFGQSSFGSGFGSTSGPFSGGTQSVGTTGFGAAASFQKPAFGAAPSFGSTSPGGFGSPPSFGGAPSFGSPTTFGATKGFGSGGFGSPSTQENSSFASLANQNTLGFGSLAQQTSTPAATQPSPFSGSSSFSSWR